MTEIDDIEIIIPPNVPYRIGDEPGEEEIVVYHATTNKIIGDRLHPSMIGDPHIKIQEREGIYAWPSVEIARKEMGKDVTIIPIIVNPREVFACDLHNTYDFLEGIISREEYIKYIKPLSEIAEYRYKKKDYIDAKLHQCPFCGYYLHTLNWNSHVVSGIWACDCGCWIVTENEIEWIVRRQP